MLARKTRLADSRWPDDGDELGALAELVETRQIVASPDEAIQRHGQIREHETFYTAPGMARLGWGLFMITLAASARGDDVVHFRVVYRSPADCPDARTFAAGITGRTERARIAKGEDSVLVEVSIQTATGNEGRVRITGKDREPIERSVRGASCNEIVDALALITALAFDPEASSESRPPSEPEPAPVEKPIAPAPPSSREEDGLEWSVEGALGVVPIDTSLPSPNLGYSAAVGASSTGALLAPELFLFGRRVSGDVVKGEGRAEFGISSFGIVACPLRFPATGAFSFRPCAGFELGALSAEGVGLLVEKKQTRFWLAPIVSARGEWRFASPLFAVASMGARFPLNRQHYSFESGEKVHDIPRISFDLGLEVGVVFF